MVEKKTFIFLNVSSSPTDVGTRAYLKAGALSQAARFSHSRRSWFTASTRQRGVASSPRRATTIGREQSSPALLVSVPASETSDVNPPRRLRQRPRCRRVSKRQREVSPPALTSRDIDACSLKRGAVRERSVHNEEASGFTSIPKHKGNSDPFGCAAIPMTAFDYAVMDTSFLRWVGIIWPSEIYLRRNHASLANGFRKYMPNVLSHAGIAHGILSEAFCRRAREAKVRGLPCESAVRTSLKHKQQAMRLLRELVQTFQTTGGNDSLQDIRCISAELGVAEIASGNFAAAQMHYTAATTALDLLGGWKTMSPVEVDCFLLPAVANAWFARLRPVLHPDRWDPRPLSDTKLRLPKSSVTTFQRRRPLPQTTFSTMQPDLRRILDQTRGLLDAEELKFSLVATESETAAEVFRWSHRRKLAVRARNLFHWCDLKDAGSGSPPSFDMILCLTARCFDHAIFEEYYLPNKPLYRPSETMLAELAAGLRSLTPPFHDGMDLDGGGVRHVLTDMEDERRFDMLWIYSVGAYVENYLLGLGRHPGSAIRPDGQMNESFSELFSTRFARLARALALGRFEDLAAFLGEEYLYCARLQEESLRRLVDS